jgi:hypothetical protein
VLLGIIFELLMIAFWIGVWRSAPHNRALRLTSGLMLGFAVLGLLAFPFPMTTDEVLGANTIHTIIWGVIAPLLMLTGIGISAAAFGNAFRSYAILTLVALVALSIATGVQAAQVNAGETVRWFGITERALMGVWLLWVAAVAITLLRPSGKEDQNAVSDYDDGPLDSNLASEPISLNLSLDERVRDFLAQRRVAVTGVSATRELTGNFIYRKLKAAGYQVFAVSPSAATFDGDPCYPELSAIPGGVDGVVIVNRPEVTDAIVRQCAAAGVPRVWMHQSLMKAGTSVSPEAVRFCEMQGISVIAGACPMMYVRGADVGHRCIRWMLRLTGGLRK